MRRSGRSSRVPADLARLVDQLWAPKDQDGAVLVTPAGTNVPGYDVVERYAVVPTARHAQLLVPLGAARRSRRALLLYNGLRPWRTRSFRRVLGEAVALGLYSRRNGDGVVVQVRRGLAACQRSQALLSEHLRGELGATSLVMSPGVRPAAPNSKPTALLLSGEGAPLGYLKLGWNVATARMVANETRALSDLAEHQVPGLLVPTLLHSGQWQGRPLLVTAPLPLDRPRKQPNDVVPPAPLALGIARTSGLRVESLGGSAYLADVVSRLKRLQPILLDAGLGEAPRELLATVLSRSGHEELTFGAWHGDWVPWNVAWFGGRLAAWDWEHSSPLVPLGFDSLHWVFQVAFILRRATLEEALVELDRRAAPALAALDVHACASDVVSLYLLEQVLRAAASAHGGGGWNPRFLDPLGQVLIGRRFSGRGQLDQCMSRERSSAIRTLWGR